MLEDKSADFAETWSFLDRRFKDEMSFASFLLDPNEVQNVMRGAIITMQNMMGIARK